VGIKITTQLFEAPVRKTIGKMQAITKLARGHKVSVGIHEEGDAAINYCGAPGSLTLAELVIIHEYGYGVPERSWLRPWFDRNEQRMRLELSLAASAELKGDRSAYQKLGKRWQIELKTWLLNGANLKPLEEATKNAREKAGIAGVRPLVATRQIIENIRVKVDGEYVD
jgi:hypothetical protein